jgi:hypothetical protein
MRHLIEFCTDFTADLEVSPKQRLERVRIPTGMRAYAAARPSVLETSVGAIEVADLYFDDGTVARLVPYECFRFVEE